MGSSSLFAPRLFLATSVALVACSLDADGVEASIRGELTDKGVDVKSVTCPDGRPRKAGDTFDCEGETASGQPFTVKVTQTEGGTVKWTLVGRVFDTESWSRELGLRMGLQLDCGKQKLIAVKGTKIVCSWAGKSTELVFSDDEGNIDADFKKSFQLE